MFWAAYELITPAIAQFKIVNILKLPTLHQFKQNECFVLRVPLINEFTLLEIHRQLFCNF